MTPSTPHITLYDSLSVGKTIVALMPFGDEQIGSGFWNLYRDLVRKDIRKKGSTKAARHWAASRTPNADCNAKLISPGSNHFEVICLKIFG